MSAKKNTQRKPKGILLLSWIGGQWSVADDQARASRKWATEQHE
jgi:hypothetical protein